MLKYVLVRSVCPFRFSLTLHWLISIRGLIFWPFFTRKGILLTSFLLKKTSFALNFMMVHYVNLDHNITVLYFFALFETEFLLYHSLLGFIFLRNIPPFAMWDMWRNAQAPPIDLFKNLHRTVHYFCWNT